ncbi:MAG TPA: hypothetical protein VJ739_11315 [Gemmataceae bacterium]|nr:hypothetical protein [Gemmataceae bacterium]
MLGCQYKVMGRFYVMVGETFHGILPEPVFLETTAEGKPLTSRPERLDGWYLGVRTGLRLPVVRRAAPNVQIIVGALLALGSVLLAGKV